MATATVLTFLLAQAPGVDINNPGTWVGGITLASILGWLFLKHLPDTHERHDKMVFAKDAQIAAKDGQLDRRDELFKKALDAVVKHCAEELRFRDEAGERRHQEVLERLDRNNDSARETVHAVRNWTDKLARRQIEADAVRSTAVAMWTKNLDGAILTWNNGAEKLFGWKASEVVGRSIYSFLIPKDRHGEEREILGRISAGEEVTEYDTVRLHRHGGPVPVVVATSPIKDRDSGKIIGASTIAREPPPGAYQG